MQVNLRSFVKSVFHSATNSSLESRRRFLRQSAAIVGTPIVLSIKGCDHRVPRGLMHSAPFTPIGPMPHLGEKGKLMVMLDTLIEDYKDSKDSVILRIARDHFKEKDPNEFILDTLQEGAPKTVIPAHAHFKLDRDKVDGKTTDIKIRSVNIQLQRDVLNEFWKARNNKSARDSFASLLIKEGTYVFYFEAEELKPILEDQYKRSIDFTNKLNEYYMRNKITLNHMRFPFTKARILKDLSMDDELMDALDQYVDSTLNLEYYGYDHQLTFLHRQGFNLQSTDQIKAAIRRDCPEANIKVVMDRIESDHERLGFIGPDGKLDSVNFKNKMASELVDLTQLYPVDDPLRIAFEIVLVRIAAERNK